MTEQTAVSIDKNDNVILAGQAGKTELSMRNQGSSEDFPTVGATKYSRPSSGAFLTRINSKTHQIEYSGYMGSRDAQVRDALPRSIGLDNTGRVVLGAEHDREFLQRDISLFPFQDPTDPVRDPSLRRYLLRRVARNASIDESEKYDQNGPFILRYRADLSDVDLSRLHNGQNLFLLNDMAVRSTGEIFVAGLAVSPSDLPGFPKMRQGKEGYQGVLLKYDRDGTPVWSTSLGGLNPILPTASGWELHNRTVAVSVTSSEVAVLANTSEPLVPTTADAMIGAGAKEGGYTIAKYRTSTEDEKACAFWTRPLTFYTTNQGGQDFNPWVVANRADCKWKVSTSNSWIRVKPRDAAQGIGLLKVDIESNYDERRTGKVVITGENGKTYEMQVIQTTKPMQVLVSQNLVELSSKNPGKTNIDVKGEPNSEWAIATDANWVRIEGPTTRTGPGQVTIRTLPNTTGAPRSAFVTVGSQRISPDISRTIGKRPSIMA